MAGNSGYVDFASTNASEGNRTLRVYWQETVDLSAGAKSTVAITKVQFASNAEVGVQYTADMIIKINGVTAVTLNDPSWTVYPISFNNFFDIKRGDAQVTGSVSGIAHESNGTKSINISIEKNHWDYAGLVTRYYEHPAKFATTSAVSQSITLATIPVGTLSISAGTGSTITVKRSGTTLSNGAALYYNDVLNIAFGTSSSAYALATNTVKIGNSTYTGGGNYTVTGTVTVTATATLRTYTLSISAGTGSTITVKRGSTTLSNGATLTYGDVLTITFGTSSAAYNLGAHTVNGSTFTSGGTHTVTGAVSVAATATLKTYTLTISQGANSTITVKRGSTTLSNGATLTYGDVLTVSFAAAPGYTIGTNTVKVGSTTSTGGGSYTVTGAVTVTSTATQTTFTLSISKGSNTNLTVTRNGTALSNGASLKYGDVLTITFSAASGYTLTQGTVNGKSFTSGGTYTVTSDVSVVTKAVGSPHLLSISQGNNTTVTVMRGRQQLSSGDYVATGDVLTISFEAQSGYTLSIHTVNGTSFTSGNTLTVTAAMGATIPIVSAAVTAGQLAEPSNVSPDVLNGTGCVDVSQGLNVTWQVDGSASMIAYQIIIYENNAASTQVYSTGQVSLSAPFWGHDYEGNVQYFTATISASALANAGIVNGNEYKLVITQWWGASSSISQNTASVFLTRAAASVSVTFGGATGTQQTFLGEYTQANGTPLNWARWTIYQGAASGTPVYDSGRIAGTGVLRVDWDGMMPEVSYTVMCEVETIDGDRASGTLLHTIPVGGDYSFTGGVTVCQQAESGIVVTWTPQPFVESYSVHRRVSGDSTFVKVADVNSVTAELTDYAAAAQTPYIYYVFPVIGGEAQEPGISEVITADFRVWSILRTSQTGKQSFSMTKRYAFRMGFGGVSQGGISNNNNPSLLQNFTKYPLRQSASPNYLSGSVSGFIGSMADGKSYSDTVSQAREIMDLAQTTDPLFLCDTKGHFLKVQTAGSSNVSVHTKSRTQPQTLSLPWVEVGDASGISMLDTDRLLAAFTTIRTDISTGGYPYMFTSTFPVEGGRTLKATVTSDGNYGAGTLNRLFFDLYRDTGTSERVYVDGDLNNGLTLVHELEFNVQSVLVGWYLGTDWTINVASVGYDD